MSDAELAAVNKVLRDIQREVLDELRALYVEATGDQERADELSAGSMFSELVQMYREEEGQIHQRIAQERAGLAAPPADLSRASPLERFLRRNAALGDETERRIGDVVSAARARRLREAGGGWGARMETAGCRWMRGGGHSAGLQTLWVTVLVSRSRTGCTLARSGERRIPASASFMVSPSRAAGRREVVKRELPAGFG